MVPAPCPTNHSRALFSMQNNHKTGALGRPASTVEHFQPAKAEAEAEADATSHLFNHLVSASQLHVWGTSWAGREATSLAGRNCACNYFRLVFFRWGSDLPTMMAELSSALGGQRYINS